MNTEIHFTLQFFLGIYHIIMIIYRAALIIEAVGLVQTHSLDFTSKTLIQVISCAGHEMVHYFNIWSEEVMHLI